MVSSNPQSQVLQEIFDFLYNGDQKFAVPPAAPVVKKEDNVKENPPQQAATSTSSIPALLQPQMMPTALLTQTSTAPADTTARFNQLFDGLRTGAVTRDDNTTVLFMDSNTK